MSVFCSELFGINKKSHICCCVVNCHNLYKSSPILHFYSFPHERLHGKRRELWIKAVNRINPDGSFWKPSKHSRICSAHFVGGRKIDDPMSPAYLPTIFPNVYQCKKKSLKLQLRRTKCLQKRNIECDSGTINEPHMAEFLETVLEVEGENDNGSALKESDKRKAEEDEIPLENKKMKPSTEIRNCQNGVTYMCSLDLKVAIMKTLQRSNVLAIEARERKELSKQISTLEASIKEIDDIYEKNEKETEKLIRRIRPLPQLSLDMIDYVWRDSKGEMKIPEPHRILKPRPKHMLNNVAHKNTVPIVNRVQIPSSHSQNHSLLKQNDVSDVIPVGKFQTSRPNLPPPGTVKRPEPFQGMKVFAVKLSYLGVWLKGKIVDIKITPLGEKLYRVRFDNKKTVVPRLITGKHIAYTDPPDVILPVGTRVVAYYREEGSAYQAALYAGIVAEPPKLMNKYRYLVFFDDGYAQYVPHKEIFLVCETSNEVWEDIHPDSKDFIRKYLKQYPERPMLKLQKGQVVKTEWNGVWWVGRVIDVDASLVKMFFDADRRSEWIYRGSTRLGPLYNELASAEASRLSGKSRRHNPFAKRKDLPYVEYTRGLDEPLHCQQQEFDADDDRPQLAKKHTGFANGSLSRNVARKSTTQDKRDDIPQFESRNMMLESQSGTWIEKKLPYRVRIKYHPHKCSSKCLVGREEDPSHFKGENPLRIPMLCGWERQILKHRSYGKRISFYVSPCGRRLRDLEEVNRHLMETESKLTMDLFCFDSYVHPFKEFFPTRVCSNIKDITYGKETVPVSCVNSLDKEYPPYVEYSNKRYPAPGVSLNLDEEFLCGCDCEDNCQNRDRCQCQQLTVAATECLPTGRIPNAGYKYRRLHEPLITGVYECNSQCKCKSNCANRVVQNGLQLRLQLFKTENKGWGIRTIDDIPQGMFICIYAGQLLTEQLANEDGNQYGDEYLAELDHIEVVERTKEGYENDIDPELGVDDNFDDEDNNRDQTQDEEDCDQDSGSESDDGRNSSGGSTTKGAYTDDSDFDVNINEPVRPKEHLTRSKGQKLRKDDSASDSKSMTCKESDLQLRGNEVVKDDKDDSVNKTTEWLTKYMESDKNESKSKVLKPCPLSPNTLEELKATTSTRKVKVTEKSESKSDRESISDSEESSRLDKSSVQDPSEAESNDGNVKKSLFSQLPDPMNCPELVNLKRRQSVRSFFNEEYCYIMDAKSCGNIGRYLNHSCSPNVFVQNVFVDTHDLRFPWVTFFANTYIRAGTELTWDYNYEVGSVPGKVLYCNCGSSECRGRLL